MYNLPILPTIATPEDAARSHWDLRQGHPPSRLCGGGAPGCPLNEPKRPRKPRTPYAGPRVDPDEVKAAVKAMLRPDELFGETGDPVVGAIKALAGRLGVNYGGLRTAMSSGTTEKRLDRLRALHAALPKNAG